MKLEAMQAILKLVKSSFSIALVCATEPRIAASASTYQVPKKSNLILYQVKLEAMQPILKLVERREFIKTEEEAMKVRVRSKRGLH